jgi:hypothetical protein
VTYRGDTGMTRSLRIDSLNAATRAASISTSPPDRQAPVTVKGSIRSASAPLGGAFS